MPSKKAPAKKIKDLKPRKGAAQKVKGGGAVGRGPVAKIRDALNHRLPDPN